MAGEYFELLAAVQAELPDYDPAMLADVVRRQLGLPPPPAPGSLADVAARWQAGVSGVKADDWRRTATPPPPR